MHSPQTTINSMRVGDWVWYGSSDGTMVGAHSLCPSPFGTKYVCLECTWKDKGVAHPKAPIMNISVSLPLVCGCQETTHLPLGAHCYLLCTTWDSRSPRMSKTPQVLGTIGVMMPPPFFCAAFLGKIKALLEQSESKSNLESVVYKRCRLSGGWQGSHILKGPT